MPRDASMVLIGGKTDSSEPVTWCPADCRSPAREAMPVPQMPIRWMRRGALASGVIGIGALVVPRRRGKVLLSAVGGVEGLICDEADLLDAAAAHGVHHLNDVVIGDLVVRLEE